MRIKSFIAATVQEALKNVKREMGDASIILETRNIEEGDIKSKTGQTLVEVVAAENTNVQSADQGSEHGGEQQDAQDDRGGSDVQSPGHNPSDSSASELQQSEQSSLTTEHEEVPEVYTEKITLSDHLHSDKQAEPVVSTPTDRMSDFSDMAKSDKIKHVSKWIVDNKVDNSIPDTDHDIKKSDEDSKLLSKARNQSESSLSGWFPSEKYSSVKRQKGLPHSEKDNTTLSDQLLAEDLIKMAGYSAADKPTILDRDSSGEWSGTSKELFKQLRLQQVEEEHSRLLINEARGRLSNDEYDKKELNLCMLRECIIHKIKIQDSSSNNQEECKTMVFVGAAGAGKTTTILKLAYNMKKVSDKEILLISIRGHSAEKLWKTADRIGATLRTVTSPRELRDIIYKNEGTSHIFVDTPGISYRDDNALSGVKGFLDEMYNKETHLIVSAETRYADIINIVNKFTIFPLDMLHFTKIDETCLYGTLLSVAMETQIPLSFFSDGQGVPEDLSPVSAEMVADMVLHV